MSDIIAVTPNGLALVPQTTSTTTTDFIQTVKDFGAVSDGVTDDTAAIQNAFGSSAAVLDGGDLPSLISGQLTINRTFRALRLKLKASATGNQTLLIIGNTSADATTTLSANVTALTNTITVTSATGAAVGKLCLITFTNPTWTTADPLAADYEFVSRIVSVSGTTIELQDNIPQAITSTWAHTVGFWTPVKDLKLQIELDLSGQGQKQVISAITKANPMVITTVNPHGYSNGVQVSINGPISGMVEAHGLTGAVTVISSTSFSIPTDSTTFTAYVANTATVRQVGTGIRLGCVDSCEIDLFAHDNDGAGAALQIDCAYQPKITVRARNCGNDSAADVQTYCWTGGKITVISDGPSGFGATILGGHYGTFRLIDSSRAATGRGFKTGKTRFCTYYGSAICNPAFTALSLTWVTQDCEFYGFSAIGSVRSAVQPTGFWTSGCYNTNNKVFGLQAQGSTVDAQVNNTDSVEFYGATIGTLDIPLGGDVTQIGGSITTLTGSGSGILKRLQGTEIVVRAAGVEALSAYQDDFRYTQTISSTAANGTSGFAALANDSGGAQRKAILRNSAGAAELLTNSTNPVFLSPNGSRVVSVTSSGLEITAGALTVDGTTVASLPAPPTVGARAFVTDSTVAASGNFGATVVGGGANKVPVYYDGAWKIG